MRINNHKLGDIVYHDQFFEYFNQLRGALNIQPDDNAILRGLQLSQSGTNVNVSAGWATGKPVFISFIKNNLGDTIRPCEEAVATGIALPNPFNGFVYLQFVMSSMVAGAAFYDVNTQLVIDTAPTAAFPTGSIIGEVCLGSVSRNGALITISNVGRDFDAAPSGSPVLANSYDASTDSPSLSGMSVPSFYRVGTAGTQVINGKAYDLDVSDLVFRDASGYSVVRGDNGGLHIEKAINYTLLTTDLPENQIVGLHNTSGASIDFTVPATYLTDTQPDYVDATNTIITVEAGQTIYVRNTQGNVIELIGSDYDPDYATNADALAQTVANKALTPINLPAITASDLEAIQGADPATSAAVLANLAKKFLTPANLAALNADYATHFSDTVPDDKHFMTYKDLVDAFVSTGRVTTSSGALPNQLILVQPGGKKIFATFTSSPAIGAAGAYTLGYSFPVGMWTSTPLMMICGFAGSGMTSVLSASLVSVSATTYNVSWTSLGVNGAGVGQFWSLWIGK